MYGVYVRLHPCTRCANARVVKALTFVLQPILSASPPMPARNDLLPRLHLGRNPNPHGLLKTGALTEQANFSPARIFIITSHLNRFYFQLYRILMATESFRFHAEIISPLSTFLWRDNRRIVHGHAVAHRDRHRAQWAPVFPPPLPDPNNHDPQLQHAPSSSHLLPSDILPTLHSRENETGHGGSTGADASGAIDEQHC